MLIVELCFAMLIIVTILTFRTLLPKKRKHLKHHWHCKNLYALCYQWGTVLLGFLDSKLIVKLCNLILKFFHKTTCTLCLWPCFDLQVVTTTWRVCLRTGGATRQPTNGSRPRNVWRITTATRRWGPSPFRARPFPSRSDKGFLYPCILHSCIFKEETWKSQYFKHRAKRNYNQGDKFPIWRNLK